MANQGLFTSASFDGLTAAQKADLLNAMLLQRAATGSKPAAGQTGREFWDTTLSQSERDNGATWDVLFGSDPAAATPGLRTLGTGAQQAAAGNHTH